MIKAQSEKTYLKIGRCQYCGKEKAYIVRTRNIEQSVLNRKAFQECNCIDAVMEREQRTRVAEQLMNDGKYDLARRVLGA